MRLETIEETARFLGKVDVDDPGCWTWTATKQKGGYGTFWLRGKLLLAHRVAYATWTGDLDRALQIDHLCRNRACVNPAHLEQVTHRENVLRGVAPPAQQAKKRTCVRGHPLVGDDASLYAAQAGKHRQCLKCRAIRDAARWRRRKAAGG